MKPIAETLGIKVTQVENTLALLEEGNTVPFIARYRKEKTEGLDEEQILYIEEQYTYQKNLQKRKEDVLRLIETQGKLTEEIKAEVAACTKISQVDDIYRPYMQKKKTRAAAAIAKGLQPLADWIVRCPYKGNVEQEAAKYVKDEVKSVEEALQGAMDIIAEMVSDDAKLRWKAKDSITTRGRMITKEKKNHEDAGKVYQMYYDFSTKVSGIPHHQIMAIDRAEKEKVITVSFDYNEEYQINYAYQRFTHHRETIVHDILMEAITDGYKRLLLPSVEREVRNDLSEKAQAHSIEVFAMNLEKLLLQPPLKGKMVLGFDPAYRTGCKLAVLDPTGKCLHIDKIFPTPPLNKTIEAEKILLGLIRKYNIQIIAIGNGTASRESESFVAGVIRKNKLDVAYTLVSEAGASLYSASENARKEFPDFHVEERSAVSIGRRIQDPLSELIKIDPQSIGVGQYQHDLPQKQLTEKLDFAVLKCVNRVGVNVNTASVELLSHVAGLNKASAQAIVDHRNENGPFTTRTAIKKVKKMGDKTFTQCAGFLRIIDGKEPLDSTSIHPESYALAKALMKEYNIAEVGTKINLEGSIAETAERLGTDEYTLKDIMDNIAMPLRDYRDQYDAPILRSDVLDIKDLREGQQLEGVVRNVVDFGAFVDIGLHDDGLVHISKMSVNRVSHPSEVVSVGDIVKVWVYRIDEQRQKVQLSLVQP